MTDLVPFFAGILECLGRPIEKAHRKFINRAGHFRRTKNGTLTWVEPHQLLAHIADHGLEPDEPKNAHTSAWMGKMAMEESIKGHNVVHAMYRRGIGWIDFTQGTPGDGPPNFEHGGGISHIRAKRDFEHQVNPKNPDGAATLRALPEVIAKGEIVANRGSKLELALKIGEHTWRAILLHVPITKENPGERWLVSGFRKGTLR